MRRRSFLSMTASLALAPLAGRIGAQTPTAPSTTDVMALLRLVPDDALKVPWYVRYADYGLQLSTMGIGSDRANLEFDTWIDAVRELNVPSAMERAPSDPLWRDSFGFDVRDIDLLLELTTVSTSITIMHGAIGMLTPARLRLMGYVPVETSGVTWYTIGDVNLLETDHYIHVLHLGYLRHVALLDDRTVVGTSDTTAMEQVLALHAGGPGSFAEGRGASLISEPPGLVSATIVDGTELVPTLDSDTVARLPEAEGMTEEQIEAHVSQVREHVARMPPIDLALLGLTAGRMRGEVPGPAARSRAVAVIVPSDPVDAEMVAETITRRLTTETVPESALIGERSWVDAFPVMDIDTAPGGERVVVTLTPADDVPSNRLIHLLWRRDLSLFFWIE